MIVVGSSRLLEKVVVGCLTIFLVSLKVDAGWAKAQKRSKRKVSKTWRTISIEIGAPRGHSKAARLIRQGPGL